MSSSSQPEMSRSQLLNDPHSSFVDPDEFFALMLSRQTLRRVDLPRIEVRGLFDPDSGQRYFVEERRLFMSYHTDA